ncbi:MAG: tetratricopeptide repeat protein [Deltaproteobacteria bacterium]|nr:tetratricopeptide repeat protein [Deltaproteobacteria bacterium]
MKISKTKIIAFFLALLLLVWFLYPRALFLGFIYEGLAELQQSEKYYRTYLEKNPHNKFGTLRLVSLYDRMGEPDKSGLLLKRLYEYRKSDWDVARKYLDHLEDKHDQETLYKTQLEVAHHFATVPRFPKKKVLEMYYNALQYALWNQKVDEAYDITLEMMRFDGNSQNYKYLLNDIDRGRQRKEKLLAFYTEELAEDLKNVEVRGNLADINVVMGRFKEALAVVDKGLVLAPDNPELFKTRIHIDDKLEDDKAALADIQKLLSLKNLKSDDRSDYTLQLASVYGRLGEKEKSLLLYRQILKEDPEEESNWLSVIYTLTDLKQTDEAIDLLKEYMQKFESGFEEEKWLANLYLYEKKDLSVLPFYKTYVQKYAKVDFALDVASLLVDQKKQETALTWLQETMPFFPRRPDRLRYLIKMAEVYTLLQKPAEAEKYYEEVVLLSPEDAESWYWLSEAYLAQDQKKKSLNASRQVVTLFEKKRNLTDAEERMFFKSRGRVHFDDGILKDYEMALVEHPTDWDWHADFLELLMNNHQWERAVPLLEKMVAEKPGAWDYRRDLALSYAETGEWQKAIAEYNKIDQAIAGDRFKVRKPLKELHEIYDQRVTGKFNSVDYGSEKFMTWGASYQGFFTEKLEFYGDSMAGHFDSPSSSFKDEAEFGKFLLSMHTTPEWTFLGGAGYGISENRNSPQGYAAVFYKGMNNFNASVELDYRTLRVDLPQAVASGDLEDKAKLGLQYVFLDRIIAAGLFEFDRNYLPNGDKGYEYDLNPSLTFVVLKKPYWTIGYQYSFAQVYGTGGFLNLVPLIQKMRANYLTGGINGRVLNENLFLGASGFIGEDTARNLQFVEGDLWGARGEVGWNMTHWLDLEISYDYGKEVLFDVPGTYQNWNVGLSGHWL